MGSEPTDVETKKVKIDPYVVMRYRLTTLILLFTIVVLAVVAAVKSQKYRVLQTEYSSLNRRCEQESLLAQFYENNLARVEKGIGLLAFLGQDKEGCERVMDELSRFESAYISSWNVELDACLHMYSFYESKHPSEPCTSIEEKSIQLIVDKRTRKLIDLKSHEGSVEMCLPRQPPTIKYYFPSKPKIRYFLLLKTGFLESERPGKLDRTKLPK